MSVTARKWVAVDFGGPEVLRDVEVDVPDPGPGQVTISVRAAGHDAIPRHGTAGPPQRGHLQVAAPHGGRREDGTTG